MRRKRKSHKKYSKHVVFVGANPAGIMSKWNTWKKMIRETKASVWFLQETKNKVAKLKLENFVIYERVRPLEITDNGLGPGGGGVAIAAIKELNPVLTREGEGDTETITIDIHPKNMVISCTSAYGPQKKHSKENKIAFWKYLDEEVDKADKTGKGFIIQGDLNARLGSKELPNDPNPPNENGRHFSDFLKRHPQLTVVNSLSLCKGLITRRRVLCTGKVEEAALDFFVVCSRVLPYVSEMEIFDGSRHMLTNYTQVKRGEEATNSDHFAELMKAKFEVCPTKPNKTEILNFKNKEEQIKFTELTTKTTVFTDCMMMNEPILSKCDKWRSIFESFCKKAFGKIRIKKEDIKPSKADNLINKRNKLKKQIEDNENDDIKNELKEVEEEIADILLKENVSKAQKFQKFCDKNSSLPMQQVWKLKRIVWPKKKPTLPMAKRNHKGRLMSAPNDIKRALAKEFSNRWRRRPSRPGFEKINAMKNKVFNLKLETAAKTKSEPFSNAELDIAIKGMNRGRARDPEGLISEIFPTMGSDLKISLLQMFNELKHCGNIPAFMRKANITPIPKNNKMSKFELSSERGIFMLPVMRGLLMRLIYNRKYDTIDSNLSDSNAGGRKKRSCRDHLWIVNGINHEHNSSVKKGTLRAQSYDYLQMFDGMSVLETMSDLYDVGLKDDHLSLIHKSNENISVSVKTPYGPTESSVLPSIIGQGDLWAPLEAAIQVDSLGSRQLREEQEARGGKQEGRGQEEGVGEEVGVGEEEEGRGGGVLYRYKGEVAIPILGLMDDMWAVTEEGVNANIMNAYINFHSANKGYQFSNSKCKTLRMGKKHKCSKPNRWKSTAGNTLMT